MRSSMEVARLHAPITAKTHFSSSLKVFLSWSFASAGALCSFLFCLHLFPAAGFISSHVFLKNLLLFCSLAVSRCFAAQKPKLWREGRQSKWARGGENKNKASTVASELLSDKKQCVRFGTKKSGSERLTASLLWGEEVNRLFSLQNARVD